jgi:hypothetical protein
MIRQLAVSSSVGLSPLMTSTDTTKPKSETETKSTSSQTSKEGSGELKNARVSLSYSWFEGDQPTESSILGKVPSKMDPLDDTRLPVIN